MKKFSFSPFERCAHERCAHERCAQSTRRGLLFCYLSLVWLMTALGATSAQDIRWQQTNGPYGGSVYCYASNGLTLFAGNYSGITRSTDNGLTWTQLDFRPTDPLLRSLAVSNTGSVFAGIYGSDGVLRSVDNGNTWTQVNIGTRNSAVNAVYTTGSTVFVATLGGVFRSTDDGNTWTSAGLDKIVSALYSIGSTVFAGTSGVGIYRSIDGGTTWTQANNGLADPYVEVFHAIGSTLFVGTSGGGVCRSTDNGDNWTQVNRGLASTHVNSLQSFGAMLFAGTGSGVSRSVDNGTTWTTVNRGLPNLDVFTRSLSIQALHRIGSTLFAGTLSDDGGVFRSMDFGNTWSESNVGRMNISIQSLQSVGSTVFANTSSWRVFRSTDNGMNWIPLAINAKTLQANGAALYAGTSTGVFRSADNGNSWTSAGLANKNVTILQPINSTLYATTFGNNSLLRSTDNGANWAEIAVATNASVISIQSIASTLFAMTNRGIVRSNDNGMNWISINIPVTNATIRALYATNSTLFIWIDGTSHNGIFRSTDNGNSWANVLPTSATVGVFHSAGSTVFVSIRNNVFRSLDNGITWANAGLQNAFVTSFLTLGSQLFAGTSSRGVFKADISSIVAVSVHSPVFRTTTFRASFAPHPVLDRTMLRLDLKAAAPVDVFIFNTIGSLVQQRSLGEFASGTHEVELSMNNLASGTYTVVIRAGLGEQVSTLLQHIQ